MSKKTKAMRLALEVLEQWNTPLYKRGVAITALREALAEQFCDNHCTWLDHHPAYNHACREMERWQQQRHRSGKDVGTTGSLCDGIAWLYGYIDELEAKIDAHSITGEPLTDERVSLIAHSIDDYDWNSLGFKESWHEGFKEGFRAAEIEHNIKGNT
jgi:CRISPR/Cas system-associated protein Cas10 (large subunit of type III CRISPR-Cas system)